MSETRKDEKLREMVRPNVNGDLMCVTLRLVKCLGSGFRDVICTVVCVCFDFTFFNEEFKNRLICEFHGYRLVFLFLV